MNAPTENAWKMLYTDRSHPMRVCTATSYASALTLDTARPRSRTPYRNSPRLGRFALALNVDAIGGNAVR